MSDSYFDQLESELRHAAASRPSNGVVPASTRRRMRLSRTALALNAALIAAAAVGFVLLLHHQPQTAPSKTSHPVHHGPAGGGAGVEYPLGADPTLVDLKRNFAILRRAQTAADRRWQPNCDCGGAARQLSGLTRYVRSLPGGDRVFFDMEQFVTAGQDNLPAGAYLMNIDLVEKDGNTSSSSFGPNTGFTVYPFDASGDLQLSAVPDGVTSVTWRFVCSGDPTRCARLHPRSVTVEVKHNLAEARVPGTNCSPTPTHRRQAHGGAGSSGRPPLCLRPTQTIWRTNGHIIASFPEGQGNLAAPPFVTGGRGTRALRALHPHAVASARLGNSFAAAQRTLRALLGPPAVTDSKVPGCSGERATVWSSPATALPLTIYAHAGRFVGYLYGAPVSEVGLVRGPGPVLWTSGGGLTLGDTVGLARRKFGARFSAHARRGPHASGGTWQLTSADGILQGALLPIRYPMRTVTSANPIATIAAGHTSCR